MSDASNPGLRAAIIGWGGSVKLLGALAGILEEVSSSWMTQVERGAYSKAEPDLETRALSNANAYALAADCVRQAAMLLQKGTR